VPPQYPPVWNPLRFACRLRHTSSFPVDFCVYEAQTSAGIASPKSISLSLGSAAPLRRTVMFLDRTQGARIQTSHSRLNKEKLHVRVASPPVSFSLHRLSSAMFLHHARPTRHAVVYLLFTVALVLVPKADILETPFDESNTPTNEFVVKKDASSWEHRQSVTAYVPRIFTQPRRSSVRRILAVYAGRLTDARTVREFLCSLLC